MASKNNDFWKGLLFLIIGVILLIGGIRVFSSFRMIIYIISVIMIYKGIQLLKNEMTKILGQILIIGGTVLIVIYSDISLELVLSLGFLVYGFYLLVIKSKTFVKNKGVFKDSRENVYIKESFSQVSINNVSYNLLGVKLRAIVSEVDLDFSNCYIQTNELVDFEITAYVSNVRINTNPSWNVILNGQYIRNIDGVNRTVNITCKNVLSIIDII